MRRLSNNQSLTAHKGEEDIGLPLFFRLYLLYGYCSHTATHPCLPMLICAFLLTLEAPPADVTTAIRTSALNLHPYAWISSDNREWMIAGNPVLSDNV